MQEPEGLFAIPAAARRGPRLGRTAAPRSRQLRERSRIFATLCIKKPPLLPSGDKQNVLYAARKRSSAHVSPHREGWSRLAGGSRLPWCSQRSAEMREMRDWALSDEFLPLCPLRSWRCFAALFLLLLALK